MIKKSLIILGLLFVAIQFIPYGFEQTIQPIVPKEEIVAPNEIIEILKRSCYDCHASKVNMPWYGSIAPISWSVKSHIEKGRKIVNFSQFSRYDVEKQQKLYEKIDESVTIRMPLASYLWVHSEAKLSDKERKFLKEWAKSQIDEN